MPPPDAPVSPAGRSLEWNVGEVAKEIQEASGYAEARVFTERAVVVRLSQLLFATAYGDALTHPTTPSPGADPNVIIESAKVFAANLKARGYID